MIWKLSQPFSRLINLKALLLKYLPLLPFITRFPWEINNLIIDNDNWFRLLDHKKSIVTVIPIRINVAISLIPDRILGIKYHLVDLILGFFAGRAIRRDRVMAMQRLVAFQLFAPTNSISLGSQRRRCIIPFSFCLYFPLDSLHCTTSSQLTRPFFSLTCDWQITACVFAHYATAKVS